MAYASLFEYLTKHVGYANGSAQRRIDAARLNNEIPEVINNIESGSVNLAQIALMQKGLRQAQAQIKNKIPTIAKQRLFEDIKEKSVAESEILINKALDIQIKTDTLVKNQQDESVRLELTLSKTQWKKLNRMRELLSNSLPHGSGWDQVLEFVAEKVIAQKDKSFGVKSAPSKKSSLVTPNAKPKLDSGETDTATSTGTNSTKISNRGVLKNTRAAIPSAIQKNIFNRDQCCQYKDMRKTICESYVRLIISLIMDNRLRCIDFNLHLMKLQRGRLIIPVK